jgi:hypothetical protein
VVVACMAEAASTVAAAFMAVGPTAGVGKS